MAAPSLADAVAELQSPFSATAQVAALKYLKNQVIGHIEKKTALIEHGIVEVLNNILATSVRSKGKRKSQDTSEPENGRERSSPWTVEDEIRIQAILLLASLAHGGPAFAAPILSVPSISSLVNSLPPSENHPRIVLASLKALLALADTARRTFPGFEPLQHHPSSEVLYSPSVVRVYADILAQRSQSSTVQSQIFHLCRLISQTCVTEHHRGVLTVGGIVDLLVARLAAYYVRQRLWSPRADAALAAALSPPPSSETLSHVIAALNAIVRGSTYRVARLLYSPVAVSIFPLYIPDSTATSSAAPLLRRTGKQGNTMEYALPDVPLGQPRHEGAASRAFPPLSSIQPQSRHAALTDFADSNQYGSDTSSTRHLPESMVIAWLIYIIRAKRGLCRAKAASLLTTIASTHYLSRQRDRMLALLVVPLLVGMIDELLRETTKLTDCASSQSEARAVREEAPAVLAELIIHSITLQKAASEAGVIKKVCQLLKQTFETIEIKPGQWSPHPITQGLSSIHATHKLGQPGSPPELVHILKCREAALKLIAALADKEDRYRKALIEHGIVPYIIDSLVASKGDPAANLNGLLESYRTEKFKPNTMGNSTPVVLAACHAARALSRSVNLLRTSLIDAGIAKPIFALLKHPSVPVLVAATDVVCNLVTEFSPMRTALLEAGAAKTLCEHAHSADSQIRMGSLWALKHLVLQSPNDVKINCFEELHSGWLVQIISGASTNVNSSIRPVKSVTQFSRGAANAAGELIDILNAVDDEDEVMDTNEDGDTGHLHHAGDPLEDTMLAGLSLLFRNRHNVDLNAHIANHCELLKTIKDAEDSAIALQAHHDELSIQVQALDFVRNFIQGPSAADMIDYLFNTLGTTRVFDIIASKLQPSFAPPQTGTMMQNGGSAVTKQQQQQQPRNEIINSTIFILVHISAGAPRHRQQLVARHDLLRHLLNLLNHHPDSGIRVSCLWAINNLTWVDDQSDAIGARQRATELRNLGFEEVLEKITGKSRDLASGGGDGDEVMDVRERGQTALEQIRDLLVDGPMQGLAQGAGAAVGAVGAVGRR